MNARNTKLNGLQRLEIVEFLAKTSNSETIKKISTNEKIDVNFSLFILIYFRCDNSQPKSLLLDLCFRFVIAIA